MFNRNGLFGKKSLLAATALAVLTIAGAGAASAQPYDHRADRMDHRAERRIDNRLDRRMDHVEHRRMVDRIRIENALRFHHYRVIGDPYFVHGHYVVRTHDRFGRVVLVRIDPYSGAFLGTFRL